MDDKKNIKTENRPWGHYDVLLTDPTCQVKRIEVAPGGRLSYQTHSKRTEVWVITAGQGTVTLNGQTSPHKPGDTIHIPLGAPHRIANTGTTPLIFIEIQRGDYFGEDDIHRIEDDYQRA